MLINQVSYFYYLSECVTTEYNQTYSIRILISLIMFIKSSSFKAVCLSSVQTRVPFVLP